MRDQTIKTHVYTHAKTFLCCSVQNEFPRINSINMHAPSQSGIIVFTEFKVVTSLCLNKYIFKEQTSSLSNWWLAFGIYFHNWR